ncbi:diaminobutyrate acetyltransferase [Ferrimonas gelatinilytica]|uniref:L-2,4-diaminobutyric acid acetyltransferase n=1 Tax=Ferrimonas gelatinilytica TaxID=1255257 RepID=A0ABP9S176_9GAMM
MSGLNTTFTTPDATDAVELHALVKNSPPLDPNSLYCNLLQCSHFADTAIAARQDGRLIGFISGYRIPERPNTLFVWQVVVAAEARGQGLAHRMLCQLLAKPACRDVSFLETTITPDNDASWALFKRLQRTLECDGKESVQFDQQRHFQDQHQTEMQFRIGPFTQQKVIS